MDDAKADNDDKITKADILAAKAELDEMVKRGEARKIGPDDKLEDFFTPEEAEQVEAIADALDPEGN